MSAIVIHRGFEQRSQEWLQARCGMVTASVIGKLVTARQIGPMDCECPACGASAGDPCVSLRGGEAIKTTHPARVSVAAAVAWMSAPIPTISDGDTARAVLSSLAAERVTGLTEETPTTGDMWRGVIAEPFARDAYAEHCRVEVEEVGLIVRDLDGMRIGYSPDGLVGDDGLIEIKCPRAKSHLETVLSGTVPTQHMAQLQTGLLVSGRAWIDYVSFSGGMHLWTKRVEPDPEWQAVILDALAHAESGISALVERYREATTGLPLTDPLPSYDDITL